MYVIIAGGGKVGWNLARELIAKGNEVTLIESKRTRYLTIEQELEHAVQYGDATELWVLERAGIARRQIGAARAADQQRIAGEDAIFHHHAHGIAGMAWRVQRRQPQGAHPQHLAVLQVQLDIGRGRQPACHDGDIQPPAQHRRG